ncbi:MAG: hypothetical protein AB8B56_02655 [Crocinitomicaceae bacterium]
MKKVLFVGAFALLSLASCKKDYTCECTTSVAGISTSASATINDTKSNAEEACEAGSSSSTVAGITSTVSCAIVD